MKKKQKTKKKKKIWQLLEKDKNKKVSIRGARGTRPNKTQI